MPPSLVKIHLPTSQGNPLRTRDGNGHVTVTEYNALNLPDIVTDPLGGTIETTYDKNGKPLTVKNRCGFTTRTEYDALGWVTKVTDPLSQTIVTTYDKVGNVKTVTDKRGIVTENVYDGLNRLTRQSRAGVRLVGNEYDGNGNVTAVIDANGHRTENSYTGRNLLDTTTFADGTGQSRTYDGVGNLLTFTDEENKVTTNTYDRENRLKTTTFAGETTRKSYDEVGNPVQVMKPQGNTRTMAYDGLKRLVEVGEGGLTTGYEYDANGNLLKQTDSLGHVVEFTYDELNRKTAHIQKKSSGSLTVSYDEYDAEGNLKQMTDAKGQVFTYTYDELNRQTVANYPNVATAYLTLQKVETGYDANNNVVSVTETKQQSGGGTVTDVTSNTYDDFDRLDTSTQRGMTVSYDYDANGNRTGVATVNGGTAYTFDARNRLATATAGGGTTSYTYTPAGRQATVSYPNGTGATYTYLPSNRVETLTHRASETLISKFAYTYDQNGNRLSQFEQQGETSETTAYTYDNLDRLKSFTVIGNDTTATAYTFDGYNRKTETVKVNGATTISKSYDYDETNWLTKVVDSAPAAAVTVAYSYDKNGNTLQKSDSRTPGEDHFFAYDAANRLVETKQGATLLGKYDYNAQGMRVRHYGSERGDVEYFYDDSAVLEEYVAGAGGGLLAHYRYADRLLSLEAGSETQYYHHDSLGSTVNLTGPAGAVKVRYTLDPWGHIRHQLGESINRMIFTGQEHDTNTGLIYFGARYYDPDTARFITQDSYLGEPGTPPSLHRYLYAYGNPTVYVDLYGNWSWPANAKEPKWDFSSADNLGSKVAQAVPEAYAKTRAAFPEAMDNAYAKGVENGVPGLDNDGTRLALTIGSTLTQATLGVGLAPLSKTVEAIEYGKDPTQLQNFPIYATSVRDTYRASETAAKDGSLNSWMNVSAAASGGMLEVAAVGSGAKAIVQKAAAPKNGITAESRAGKANVEHISAGNRPPYDEAKSAREIVLNRDRSDEFVRVHGEYNQARPWIMRKKEIEGLSPGEIKEKFAIPNTPTKISDVSLPSGTKLRVGTAGAQEGWGIGGKIQYEILQGPGMKGGRVPESWFTNQREL